MRTALARGSVRNWVAACDAGDLRTVELLLPVVEHTVRGVNCTDGAGVTGLMAALEKGRLEVVAGVK